MSQVDLHIHFTASDGRLSPEEIVLKSAELRLKVLLLLPSSETVTYG